MLAGKIRIGADRPSRLEVQGLILPVNGGALRQSIRDEFLVLGESDEFHV